MDCYVRPATVSDIEAMHNIRCMVAENRLTDPQRISVTSYAPFIEARSIWVAETRARIVGFSALDCVSASVWALFVDPAWEGRGIGRALHDHVLLFARQRELRRLILSTDPGTRAARFYAWAGWREVGTSPEGEARFEILLPG